MRGFVCAALLAALAMASLSCARQNEEAPPPAPVPAAGKGKTEMGLQLTPYDRVNAALAEGKLGPKEAVLLKARLIFEPASLPAGSPYAPAPGEAARKDLSNTGFYKEVLAVLPQLSPGERDYLRKLSPDLAAILAANKAPEKLP